MATRVLTIEYNNLQKQFHRLTNKRNQGQMASLIGNEDNLNKQLSSEVDAPFWVEQIKRINNDLKDIETKSTTLEATYKNRLSAVFDDQIKTAEVNIQIQTQAIMDSLKRVEMRLKRLAEGRADQKTESIVRQNVQRGLACRLQDLSLNFRKNQKDYVTKLQNKKAGGAGNSDDVFSGFGPDMNDRQNAAVDMMKRNVQERDQEIQKISKSIEELAIMFKDLGTLVIEQGSMVDRIDYNMEQTVVRMKEGVQELVKADEHQKSSRPMKIMMTLALIVLVLVIIIIVKMVNKANANKTE
ncbi:hypothetical protein WA158_007868 [Blastocystis sp. Blastoise]